MLKKLVVKNWFILLFSFVLIFNFSVRIYQLDLVPPSPYWEEVALGYDAYSVLLTGKDHHGHPWPIVAFESFGDHKPSLYFYLLLPFVKIFGLNTWAVRLPAALCGVLITVGCSYLVYLLFAKNQGKRTAQYLALFVLLATGLNPWLIQFSRGGWEITLATTLITWGVVSWVVAIKKVVQGQKATYFFILTGLLFGLSMYAQHSARLIAPLLGVWLVIWSGLFVLPKTKLKYFFAQTFIVGLVALLIILPITKAMFSNQVQQRFLETSIFTDLSIIEKSNEYRELNHYSLASRIFYHRYLLFGQEIAKNFLTHLRLDYLFLNGDSNPRHSTQFFGLFYHLDLPIMLLGTYYLVRHKKNLLWLVGGWLIISFLPASISTGSPHALRTLPGFGAWVILLTAGIAQIFLLFTDLNAKYKTLSRLVSVSLIVAYLVEFIWFSKFYFQVYPVLYAQHWQFGYQQMVQTIASLRLKYPDLPVYITREQGRPAMYYWFYTQTDPLLVQQAEAITQKDQGEFLSWLNVKFIDKADQISSREFLLASSSQFVLNARFDLKTDFTQILASQGENIWQVGLYQK